MRFFRSGSRVAAGELCVYNALGGVVRRVEIGEGSGVAVEVGGGRKRVVGAWDLTDARGRLVSPGVYMAKGAITTRDGGRERVMILIGVVAE